jgi:hypothetical protein
MSERKDLTRWNRAGRTRFRYVDGKAGEYLEILRQQLVEQFADPETGLCEWLNPAEEIPVNEKKVDKESLIQRQERLSRTQERILEMYHQDRRDWGWEISRTFARACHILTEHTNAYANEGYLGTATQWDHVRRLIEMLDYHPAPPASAYTRLAFEAKENKTGTVAKGFKVQHTPETGGPKIIFETLEDIFIDPELNELRPKDWNQSDAPVVNNGGSQPPGERQFSPVANGPVINLQGVGDIWSDQLNSLTDPEHFKIKDFLDLDPDNPGIILDPENEGYKFEPGVDPGAEIGAVWLREFNAKATAICYFELESDWSDIVEWLLKDIASNSPESLMEITGNTLNKVVALQRRIELISAYLDQPFYAKTKLKDLITPAASSGESDGVETLWRTKQKPKVNPGDVAMIFHKSENKAEAATIGNVNETNGFIDLLPSPVQYNWGTWPESKATLFVSPRWKRECWLNGSNVLRTVEPHGLSDGAFISWKQNSLWKFAKVIEADKRGLRLDAMGNLPEPKTLLYEGHPLESNVMATTLEAIGLVGGGEPNVENAVFGEAPEPIFKMKDPVPNDPSAPPFMPPGSLSFGSFLFPTPMLPMDLVKAAVDMMLNLGVMIIPSTGEVVFKSLPEPGALPTVNDLFDILEGKVEWRNDLTTETQQKAALAEMLQAPVGAPIVMFQNILDNLEEKGPLIAVKKYPPIKAVVEANYPRYLFDSGPDKIEAGDWTVGRFTDGLRALKVKAINEFTDSDKNETFSLSFENLVGNEGELQKVYADFRGSLTAEGASVNTKEIDSEELELEDVPDSLKIGRTVLLTGCGKEPVAAKIESIDGNIIKTNPQAVGCTKGKLIIYGNVVHAGHGEVKPVKIMGSGDAARSNQEFILEVDDISFPPDTTKTFGVAAATEVEVAGRVWEQVSTLKDSTSGDHHYAIRMTEEGYVKILFGDGEYGRRLPTGKNNIRVRYRVGSGLAGNVDAGGLEKPVNPHPLIKTIKQPLRAEGGGDMEDVSSLRENAPPTLLALERAVSLSDFVHLAASQSSVWQAKAYSEVLYENKMEGIQVVIVPAGGATSTDVEDDLEKYLQQLALPGVQVTVDDCVRERFSLAITLRVKSEQFVVEDVKRTVTVALKKYFTLQNRRLGEHLYLSEVYKVVENIQGVENSICVLNNDDTLQLIRATSDSMVVYLDTETGSTLEVYHEEYQP